MSSRFWLVWLLAMCSMNLGGRSSADPPAAKQPTASRKTPPPPLPAFTPEREAAAVDFVARNHAELSSVLVQLKGIKRDEYEQAIRELSQTQERLELIKPADEPLHELTLEAWKADSQIKLLAARLACAKEPDAAIEAELKSLLFKQVDLQRQIVEHNHERALAAVEDLETNIKWLKDHRDKLVDLRFRNLTRSQGKSRANKAVPAAEPDKAKGE